MISPIARYLSGVSTLAFVLIASAGAAEADLGMEYTVRLVNAAGKPVAAAKVGLSANGVSDREPRWAFYSPSAESDENGVARLRLKARGDGRVLLYALDKSRRLAAFTEVAYDGVEQPITVTLAPLCLVTGRLSSPDLAKLGHRVEWTSVYLFRGQDRPLSFTSMQQEFEFLVPAGKYKLRAYGENLGDACRDIEVAPAQTDLQVGALDLPATRLVKLFGQPAPELRQVKGWKNGQPVTLESLRGKVVVLDFWGYWCGPCIRQIPTWMALDDDYAELGLVVIGVHDDSVKNIDEMNDKLRAARQRKWWGRDISYLVALDGGGATPIEGTQDEVRGATTAAYGITSFPTGVLIDREGKVVDKFEPTSTKSIQLLRRMLEVEEGKDFSTLTHESTWTKRFDERYGPVPGEVLTRIAPPFIAQRAQYVTHTFNRYSGDGEYPQQLVLMHDGRQITQQFSAGPATLSKLLLSLVPDGMPDNMFDCPRPLAGVDVPGDWLVLQTSSLPQRLAALEPILAAELGRKIHFELRQDVQEVIVATGRYEFHPLPGATGPEVISLTVNPEDHRTEVGGFEGTLPKFLGWISRFVGRRVIDEVADKPSGTLTVRQRESAVHNFKADSPPKLDTMLEYLTKQTSVRFRRQRRSVDVWHVTTNK